MKFALSLRNFILVFSLLSCSRTNTFPLQSPVVNHFVATITLSFGSYSICQLIMTALCILDDVHAEVISGGNGLVPSVRTSIRTFDLTKITSKVSYDQVNSLQNNVGATILTRGAVLAASITATQLNSIGGGGGLL